MERHILLVDDNPNDVELALTALSEVEAQQVTVAHSGQEALNILQAPSQPAPDLILLDLKMPHMDGLAVLDAVRADRRLREIPVVMLTTSGEEGDIKACYEHGATAYVVKPLDFTQFRDALNTILRFWTTLNRSPRVS
ncbi:response regulator [Deinococcus cavernae]|uniref:Response regulator n=1 Tax=Deinococcus cavernae TaxID=2320857 RepID=A0A418VAV9_9DEIO|nr:response regulator [Deinococcus cavernae]RJF73264.1 response regulator [Deinococcus cavernae]